MLVHFTAGVGWNPHNMIFALIGQLRGLRRTSSDHDESFRDKKHIEIRVALALGCKRIGSIVR